VVIATSMRWSASIGRTIPGNVTVTSAGSWLIRSGDTAEPGSVRCLPSVETSYSLANSTAPSAGGCAPGAVSTRTRMVDAPLTNSWPVSGSLRNRATWPGMSMDSLLDRLFEPLTTEPRPGMLVIDAGLPPGGFTTICCGPLSAIGRRSVCVPFNPG
jgi:hypothetical protein